MIKKLLAVFTTGLIITGSIFWLAPYAKANEQQITSIRAREIAQGFVGHGTATGVRLFPEDGTTVFEVEVQYGEARYVVHINAINGAVIRMNHFTAGQPTAAPPGSVTQAAPTPARRIGGRPVNPAISLERAIQIGYEELARRGLSGTFRNHSGMDWERGQWVWEIVYRVPGGRLPLVEMYINVHTGAVVKFEWDD